MKKISTLLILLISAISAFSQKPIYTAIKSSSWSDATMWQVGLRTDGVNKTKVIIPAGLNVRVDNSVNAFGLGSAEISISGTLTILTNTTIALGSGSVVEITATGSIIGTLTTQAITIGGVKKYDGALDLTKTGSYIANSVTGFSPNGFVSTLVLPVTLVSFNAFKSNSDINLRWITASETSNDYFLVESSTDGASFSAIGMVKGSVNSSTITSYSYTHRNVTDAIMYYRLKQYDTHGAYTYSEIKKVAGTSPVAAKIYRSSQAVNVELPAEVNGKTVVSVMNASGSVIARQTFNAGKRLTVNIESSPKGIVFVSVSDNKEFTQTAKLLF